MSKGILQLALSGEVPLQLEYREPGRGENTENRGQPTGTDRLCDIHTKSQIADALAWPLHVI